MPYFLLNDITLFYHDISSTITQTGKQSGAVKNWRSLVTNQASKSRRGGPGSLAESAQTLVQSKGRTTTSSSAARIKTEEVDDMTVTESRGFNDEDESQEREHALSSPIKGNKWLNSTVSSTN